MNKQNRKHLLLGLVLGIVVTLSFSPISAMTDTITAFMRPGFQFYFNGTPVPIPAGQTVLVYEGRSYVPARFVAENLGADVLWDDVTQRIFITAPEPVAPEVEEEPVVEPEVPETAEEEEKEEDIIQPAGTYRKTPVTQYFRDLELTVTSVLIRDRRLADNRGTRVFIRVQNNSAPPLEILQMQTTAIVDGVEHKSENVPVFQLDSTWHSNIRRNEVREGYLSLPDIPENAEKMAITIRILENDHNQNIRETELLIDLR